MKYTPFYSQQFLNLQAKYHISSLNAKIIDYMKLNDETIQSLNKMIFHDYDLFSEGDEVYERIMEAIENEEKIVIYGDYDMDGILATTILVKAFSKLGVKVGYHIPNRFKDGYGLNVERVEQIAKKGYSLIITVDNGISAFDAVEKAEELGVDVIITDHHTVGEDVPLAYAFLHTSLSPNYPFKPICGGMVAYKLAVKMLGKHDAYLFTLAACTTISDMMPLRNENRAIVKKALQLMNTKHYPAFNKLLNDPMKPITATSIGFEIAPKVNSAGRLPDLMNPNSCVQYFLNGETDSQALDQFALKIKNLNSKRQSMTNSAFNELNKTIDPDLPYIFIYEHEIHEGLLGLLAAKFSNEYHKVAFVLNYDEANNIYKGSARSLPGFKLHEFLTSACEDLEAFGGHDGAAGFSVKYDRIPSFEAKIKEAIEAASFEEEESQYLVLEDSDLSIKDIEGMRLLEPFGIDFEKPVFGLENVTIVNQTILKNNHLKLLCQKGNMQFSALWFFHKELISQSTVTLIGDLSINEFRGKSIQFMIKDIL